MTFAKQSKEVEAFDLRMEKVLGISAKEALLHAKFYGMVTLPWSTLLTVVKPKTHPLQTGLSGNMIILSVLYYGGSLVTSDVITVGNLASFVLYAAYVGIGLSGVSTFYAESKSSARLTFPIINFYLLTL